MTMASAEQTAARGAARQASPHTVTALPARRSTPGESSWVTR
ncbi:hypothetical protein AB0L05_03520 [Nonomuraea pusilla]